MLRLGTATLLLLLVVAGSSHAQGTARSLDLDPSVRASGMGGVSNAVIWGAPPDAWANPALIGLMEGVGYEWGHTRLVPQFANDVTFESKRLFVGSGGVGLAFSGQPEHFGSIDLDYGLSQGFDENGNPTGTFSSFEHVRSIGFGLSLAGLLDGAARAADFETPEWFDRFDVGWGANFKHVEMSLAPGFSGTGDAEDQGAYARVTPYLSRWRTPEGDRARFDIAVAHSTLNRNDAVVTFPLGPVPTSRIERDGVAIHGIAPRNPWRWDDDRWGGDHDGGGRDCDDRDWGDHHSRSWGTDGLPRWCRRGFQPFLEFGAGWDHESVGTTLGTHDYDVNRYGLEVTLEQIVTGRIGYVDDPSGQVQAATYGFGLQLPIGRVAGVRYDFASLPQADDLDRVSRHALFVWLNPLELARVLRDHDGLSARAERGE